MLCDPASAPLPDDVATLQALVAGLSAQLAARDREVAARDRIIDTLKNQLAALRRRTFGHSSEKLGRIADQLELQIEELEQHQAEHDGGPTVHETAPPPATGRRHPVRTPLPAHLPRVEEELPGPYAACPGCGGALRRIGEDFSEVLEMVPARLRVRRHHPPGDGLPVLRRHQPAAAQRRSPRRPDGTPHPPSGPSATACSSAVAPFPSEPQFAGKARQALAPGGVFVSLHKGLTAERTQPETHIVGRLAVALRGQGRSFDQGVIAAALSAAGFASVDSRDVATAFGPFRLDCGRG